MIVIIATDFFLVYDDVVVVDVKGLGDGACEHGVGALWVRRGAVGGDRHRILPLHLLPALRCQGTALLA